MHHMYPVSKGDQLCPLGFHPQVRWPTRCKRCFRDYKEHSGAKRADDVTTSTPSLSDQSISPKSRTTGRSWTSTSNLSSNNGNSGESNRQNGIAKRPSSWTSTPDLDENANGENSNVSVSISLPRRRHTTVLDISQVEESITIKRPPLPRSPKEPSEDTVILRTDSLAERVRKMQLLKKQNSLEREKSLPRSSIEKEKPPSVEVKKRTDKQIRDDSISKKQDLQFLIQVKDNVKFQNDDSQSTNTETTSTTLVDNKYDIQDLQEQIESLKRELDTTKARAERAERDKSDILLRRLASMDTVPNRTAASEALKLQQKVNELNQQLEDLRDDKKVMSFRVKELEQDLRIRPTKTIEDDLRKKLQAAETLCEELMDENEDMKKELRNMEQEIDEMADNFREDQADEYSTIKKELEKTTKNCRILSFKLKKSERKIEQLESDKPGGGQPSSELLTRIKTLEEELSRSNEIAKQLQTEAENNLKKGTLKAPSLGIIGKSTSADNTKYSRASLTRGGSQEDPVQLLRDLQDSMEREADIREQLKFAEEEAENLRKKSSRVEDENESLMIQLKKMATKARSRKLSPTAPSSRLTLEAPLEKDEGISDEEDPAELRVLLELNEQESSQLRRKVEELETNGEANKKQIKELQEKLKEATKTTTTSLKGKLPTFLSKTPAGTKDASEKKIKELEQTIVELKKTNKYGASVDTKSVDFKQQLTLVEREATVLRAKVNQLEQDNDKMSVENKKLTLQIGRANRKDSLTVDKNSGVELIKIKETLQRTEKERDDIGEQLKGILEAAGDRLPPRIAKTFTDSTTKIQLQKMVTEMEDEIKQMRAIVVQTGGDRIRRLEIEKAAVILEVKETKEQLTSLTSELKYLKAKTSSSAIQTSRLSELERKAKKSDEESTKLQQRISELEDKINKKDALIKQAEAGKAFVENQLSSIKEKMSKLEKEFEKEKKEKSHWESKVTELDGDYSSYKKMAEKTKLALDKEILTLKTKASASDTIPTKRVKELEKQKADLIGDVARETKKYTELTGRYEQLEEEHVLRKAQLTSDKEKLQSEITVLQTKLQNLEVDHKKSTEANTELIYKINDLEKRYARTGTIEKERDILRSNVEEKDQQLMKLRKENEMNKDLSIQMRRENDELRKKLGDFEKVNKVQASFTDHSLGLEQEIKKLKSKLEHTELNSKSDVATIRLRYEQQVKNLHTEMTSLQRQCEKFKRDRDTFKQLLEAAQKSIRDLKSNNSSGRVSRASLNSADEDDKSKILLLEQQVGCLEDELCEARLDAGKLKTELVSEKSISEIKISEMQSRLNEYEEERLLGTGRTKIPGIKTKLELSWQKEREDQQRLLQETSTLARDLRQTLFEVERERDKERLETRRKLEQLKRSNDEELDEGRRKISELQCDLLELRDAHAKLRTSNEKLRRERERNERDRDNGPRKRMEQDGERKVGALLQTVDELVKIAPELQMATSGARQGQQLQLDTPKRLIKSRSPSPGPTASDTLNSIQISSVLARLAEASEELRRYQRICEDDKERDRIRRTGTMRRAASTENETPEMQRAAHRLSRSSTANGSLYRKSLSLDQSMQNEQSSAIWKQQADEDTMSSMQSIDSEMGTDSRLSGGSIQSDLLRAPRKKKRGLMNKLKSLAKSRGAESEGSVQGSDSDASVSSEYRSKGKLGRLSGMFKKSGSTSRGNSTERILNDSVERPVAVTTVSFGQEQPPQTTPRMRRAAISKPPPSSTTPSSVRKSIAK